MTVILGIPRQRNNGRRSRERLSLFQAIDRDIPVLDPVGAQRRFGPCPRRAEANRHHAALRIAEEGRKVWNRRVSLIPVGPGEGRLTEPTAAVRPWSRERVPSPKPVIAGDEPEGPREGLLSRDRRWRSCARPQASVGLSTGACCVKATFKRSRLVVSACSRSNRRAYVVFSLRACSRAMRAAPYLRR
jgi:hypothetical protein